MTSLASEHQDATASYIPKFKAHEFHNASAEKTFRWSPQRFVQSQDANNYLKLSPFSCVNLMKPCFEISFVGRLLQSRWCVLRGASLDTQWKRRRRHLGFASQTISASQMGLCCARMMERITRAALWLTLKCSDLEKYYSSCSTIVTAVPIRSPTCAHTRQTQTH